jgi:transcriptional regulator GlxA family with amidase domain
VSEKRPADNKREELMMAQPLCVGILLFHDVEVLDFAGPYEVFSIARRAGGEKAFCIKTVAQATAPIIARDGLKIIPDCDFDSHPPFDVLIVPGGPGARETEVHNERLIGWLRARSADTPLLASVCTGAFLLASAGLLKQKNATTHWASLERFEKMFPGVFVRRLEKFVDEREIVTSAGVSAGIDMSLHLVGRLLGEAAAKAAAERIEYTVLP